jgi:hypothetical protein
MCAYLCLCGALARRRKFHSIKALPRRAARRAVTPEARPRNPTTALANHQPGLPRRLRLRRGLPQCHQVKSLCMHSGNPRCPRPCAAGRCDPGACARRRWASEGARPSGRLYPGAGLEIALNIGARLNKGEMKPALCRKRRWRKQRGFVTPRCRGYHPRGPRLEREFSTIFGALLKNEWVTLHAD